MKLLIIVVCLILLGGSLWMNVLQVREKQKTETKIHLSPYDHYGRDVAWMQSVLAFRYDSSEIRNGTGEYAREEICKTK